jgi:outer membrane protein OmpA-like peptidoglycan-associated protein
MRTSLRSLVLSVTLLVPPAGAADAAGFNGQRYAPAAGAAGGFAVERPFVPPHLGYGLGLFLNYADDPVVARGAGDDVLSRPLDSALGLDLLASLALFDVFELSLDLPFHAVYEGDPFAIQGSLVQAGAGIGDVRAVPKLAVATAGKGARYAIGLAVPVTFPTGSSDELRGDDVVTAEPKLLLGMRGRRFGVTANAGIRLRSGDQSLGQELTFGGAAQLAVVPHRDLVDLVVEATGGRFLDPDVTSVERLPVEVIAGAVLKPNPRWEIYLGGGPGLTDGLGAANYRIVAGVRHVSRPTSSYSDADGDGLPDFADRCPARAEDHDGFQDDDGCPEDDNDRDGVADDADECPDEPGDRASDGCPAGDASYEGDHIVIRGKIQFETGSAKLKAQSGRLLDQVAAILRAHPEIRRVRVDGHTDSVGSAASNEQLSLRRSDAVREALISRGVEPGRLSSRGYGQSRPIAPNKTRAGRAKNRRVEFTITD